MSLSAALVLIMGAFAGGFINGFAGTGTALFALAFYLAVLEPPQAVAIVALMSALVGLQGVWVVRAAIRSQWQRTLRFVLPGLFGVPVGLALLAYVDARGLKLLIAGFLVVYGAYFGLRSTLPRLDRRTPLIDAAVGFGGGVLGGLASISGALPSMWVSMRPWTKAEARAVMQPLNVVILSFTVGLLMLRGSFTTEAWTAFALTFPVGLVAAQVGIAVFRRVGDDMFRRVLILLCLMMGLGIFARELLA